jgi:hypothetical protein
MVMGEQMDKPSSFRRVSMLKEGETSNLEFHSLNADETADLLGKPKSYGTTTCSVPDTAHTSFMTVLLTFAAIAVVFVASIFVNIFYESRVRDIADAQIRAAEWRKIAHIAERKTTLEIFEDDGQRWMVTKIIIGPSDHARLDARHWRLYATQVATRSVDINGNLLITLGPRESNWEGSVDDFYSPPPKEIKK